MSMLASFIDSIVLIPMKPEYFRYLWDGVVCAVALTLWALVFWWAWNRLKKKQQIQRAIHLVNQSNVSTTFQFQADFGEAKQRIQADWFLDGRLTVPQVVEQVTYQEEKPDEAPAARSSKKGFGKPIAAAKGHLRFLKGVTSLVAGISSAIASLLPDAVKGPFQGFADSIRDGQKTVADSLAKPKAMETAAKQLKSNTSQLSKTMGGGQGKPGQGLNGASAANAGQPVKQFRRTVVAHQAIQTATLPPGESVFFLVKLRPRNPFRKVNGQLNISSQQVENIRHPAAFLIKPVQLSEPYAMNPPRAVDTLIFIGICLGVLLFNSAWAYGLMVWFARLTARL